MPFTDTPLTSSNTVADWLAVTNRITAFLEANVLLLNETTTGNLTLNGVAIFWANASVNGNFLVSGLSHLTGNTTLDGFANVATTLQVTGNTASGNTNVTGWMNVSGLSTFTGNVTTAGFVNVATTLKVQGVGTFGDIVNIAGQLIVAGIANITGNTVHSGRVSLATAGQGLWLPAGNTTANCAPLKFTTQASPLAAIEAGTMEYIGHSLQFSKFAKRRGIVMSMETITADNTTGNSTAQTSLTATTHEANYLEVGFMDEVRLYGTVTQRNNSAAFLTIGVWYDTTQVLTVTGPNAVAIAAGTPFTLELETTCRATGAGTGIIRFDSRWKIGGITNNPDQGNTVTTADTTAAKDINVTFQWNENRVEDTITVYQGRCLCIDPAR